MTGVAAEGVDRAAGVVPRPLPLDALQQCRGVHHNRLPSARCRQTTIKLDPVTSCCLTAGSLGDCLGSAVLVAHLQSEAATRNDNSSVLVLEHFPLLKIAK